MAPFVAAPSIDALPLTVARDAGCQIAYLPGLAVRGSPSPSGEAETSAKAPPSSADAARTLRTLDLTGEANRASNRIRGLLPQFRLSLERVYGPGPNGQAVTWLLKSTYPLKHFVRRPPPPHQRPLHHAPRRNLLRAKELSHRLTKT